MAASENKWQDASTLPGLDDFHSDPLFRRMRQHAEQRMEIASGLPRNERFPAYKRFLDLEEGMLRRYHQKGDGGFRVTRAKAILLDVFIEYLFADALATFEQKHGPLPCRMAVVATGGYGRGELSPHSDLDLMLLYPDRCRECDIEQLEEVLSEEILYPLWDLRFKVGHSSRNPQGAIEEARKEIKSKNAFLDARFICGSRGVFNEFTRIYRAFIKRDNVRDYVRARLADKKDRHERSGGSVFVQEPDIKNGMGGLRDFHSVLWLASLSQNINGLEALTASKYMDAFENRDLLRGYDFLLRVRNEVHFQHKRPTEVLALDEQPAIAKELGYREENIFKRVERFMKDYYRHARNIHHISEMMEWRLIQEEQIRRGKHNRVSFRSAVRARRFNPNREIDGFLNEGRVLYAVDKKVFKEQPARLIRVFRHAQRLNATIDFGLENLIEQSHLLIDRKLINDDEANRAFRSILQTPGAVHPILQQMHRLGVLGRFLPEFGKLDCLVQHEYYHRYTADVHVLNTIRELDRIFRQEDPERAAYLHALRETNTPGLLYLILLLHDIGKAQGIKGHAESGVRIARPMLQRMGVEERHRGEILFIIRNHLEMARFWQKFDIDDPQTSESFAQFIGDERKLRYLYVHTYCDAQGTAKSLWNSYKNSLHTLLYQRTLAVLQGDESKGLSAEKDRKPMIYKEIVSRQLPDISEEEIEAHFNLLPERYFIHSGADEIELHIKMVHRLLTQINEADSVGSLVPIIDWRDDVNQSLTTVNIVTWDRAGLFYKLAGALSAAGLNILSTKAISRSDHITMDTFYVVDAAGGFVRDQKAQNLFEEIIARALANEEDLWPAIEKQAEKIKKAQTKEAPILKAPIPPRVDVYHELSLRRTIIEVQAKDDIGLLYQLSKSIFDNGFDITFARISTEQGVAIDTFYIESVKKGDSETKSLLSLRDELNSVVQNNLAATG